MKCEGCGEEWLLGHRCGEKGEAMNTQNTSLEPETKWKPKVTIGSLESLALENIYFALRDVVEELKKFNEREQRKEGI